MTRRRSTSIGLAMAMAMLLGCQLPGKDRPHTALGPDAGALRSAFNADSGNVRVVMLLAPT